MSQKEKLSKEVEALTLSEAKMVRGFIRSIKKRKEKVMALPLSEYKKNILKVSTWDKTSLKVFEDNSKLMNQWKITGW